MKKAVFFDRDGTLNMDDGHTYDRMIITLFPDAPVSLKKLQDAGFLLVVVTNQGGIETGKYTEEQVIEINSRMEKLFSEDGVKLDSIKYCPHNSRALPENRWCRCMKPNTGMIDDAVEEFDIDRNRSWMIGDKTSDILAGKKANLKTILMLTGEAGEDKRYSITPDHEAKSLLEAAEMIIER